MRGVCQRQFGRTTCAARLNLRHPKPWPARMRSRGSVRAAGFPCRLIIDDVEKTCPYIKALGISATTDDEKFENG